MPFKSEKQRRYLWANEPEIARDWTDTYGSGIAKALGGRIPFAEGSGKTSIPQWNLATLQTALETATSDEERAKIHAQIDRVEGDIGTAADTLLGSGEVPTKGITSKILEFIFGSPAEGSIPTEQERIALMNSMQEPTTGIMKAGGYPFIDPADGNYISRDPRLAEYALSDDYENIDRFTETEDEPSKWNWGNVGEGIGTLFALANETLPWSWARRGWDALTSGFSGQRTPRDPNFGRGLSGNVSWAGQRYDKQYGTGAYKMKTLRDRYDRLKKSKSQSTWNAIQKEKVRKELAAKEAAYKKKSREAWQKDYSGWQSPSGRDHASTAGIGSRESKQGHSGSSHVGASRFR